MYERLLDKTVQPTVEFIEGYLGASHGLLMEFERFLNSGYDLTREMRFPFGNSYGWGFKYSHRSSHLCYAFFEKGAFTVMLQIGDKQVPSLENHLPSLLRKTRDLWLERGPCGKCGGWVHYQVLNKEELGNVIELVKIKKKPISP